METWTAINVTIHRYLLNLSRSRATLKIQISQAQFIPPRNILNKHLDVETFSFSAMKRLTRV